MPEKMKIYKIKDFIRKNESGVLSFDQICGIIKEIATAAAFYPENNILLDFRRTTIGGDVDMNHVLKTSLEMGKYKDVLANKIANVIPQDENRFSYAKMTEAAIQIKGIQYKIFTDFESAIEWLSETE